MQSWRDPAERLVAVLRQTSDAMSHAYGHAAVWRSPDGDDEAWQDVDAVRKIVEASLTQDRDEDAPAGRGIVHGALSPEHPSIVDLLWSVGVEDRVLDCTARFNPRGGARSLARHEPDWLAGLLGSTVDAAQAAAGRVVTSSWLKEDERRMRHGAPEDQVPFWLGELTFLPTPVDASALPRAVITRPCSTVRGAGAIAMLADLSATVVNPAAAVDAMLALRPHLPVVGL